MTGRMGEMIQHGGRWIVTDEGKALELIDTLRLVIDHAVKGDFPDPGTRIEWLRLWREADRRRALLENKSGADLSTNDREKRLQAQLLLF